MSLALPAMPAGMKASANAALAVLQNLKADATAYRGAMIQLGHLLAELLARQTIAAGDRICLAMTVEDADFLGAGALEVFEKAGADVSIACFWNVRQDAFGLDWADMAPVVQEYVEPLERIKHLVILKSIISGSCVVRSNLEHLFDTIVPEQVHIAAPVMLTGADERLEREFPRHLVDRFQYWTFEIDSAKSPDGNVEPGIGGEVYGRLGLGDKVTKNAVIPELVRRRARKAA